MYEEWEFVLVPMTGARDTNYRVFSGTVNWDREPATLRRAVCVLIQYGSTEDWRAATGNREINFQMPAHILVEDLDAVRRAMDSLSIRAG